MKKVTILKTKIWGEIKDYELIGDDDYLRISEADAEIDFFEPQTDIAYTNEYKVKDFHRNVGGEISVDLRLSAVININNAPNHIQVTGELVCGDNQGDTGVNINFDELIPANEKKRFDFNADNDGGDYAHMKVELTHIKKYIIDDYTTAQPAFVEFNGIGFLAWIGKDGTGFLNIMQTKDLENYTHKHTFYKDKDGIELKSDKGPSICVFNNKLYIAFKGYDKNIYIASSTDGINWNLKNDLYHVLSEQSITAPSLISLNGKLYLAWIATNNICYLRWSNDGKNWNENDKISNYISSNEAPSIANCFFDKILCSLKITETEEAVFSCFDTYSNVELNNNYVGIDDNKEATPFTPSICEIKGNVYRAWSGNDENHTLNVDILDPFIPHAKDDKYKFDNKVTYWNDTSDIAPCIAKFEDTALLIWAGAGGQINLMKHII